MDNFVSAHDSQLQTLNIPFPLYEGLKAELESSFLTDGSLKENASNESQRAARYTPTEHGKMLVIPHLCSWDVVENPSRGLWEALRLLPMDGLKQVHLGLDEFWGREYKNDDIADLDNVGGSSNGKDGEQQIRLLLMDLIGNHCWAHVILYRDAKSGKVRAALPAPPYFPQVSLDKEDDPKEADLTGPFPFQYHMPNGIVVETSLAYLSPDCAWSSGTGGSCLRLPTLDVVPMHAVKNVTTRAVRYAALLGNKLAPPTSVAKTKELYANFALRMHLLRQDKLNQQASRQDVSSPRPASVAASLISLNQRNGTERVMLKVYTDHDDPLQLAHPRAGLDPALYSMTDSMEEADIIYSYGCLFSPGATRELIETRWALSNEDATPLLINQFPYEGAMVSKDHLARGILQQHGLPLPSWALESYDLDVNLAEFVGYCLLAKERGEDPIWIGMPCLLVPKLSCGRVMFGSNLFCFSFVRQ
jgi:hypothetical protein